MIMNGRSGVGGGSGGGRFPFTASQWQELEHQALIFKYMVSGVPIPPDLLFTIRRSCSDSSSKLFAHPTASHIGWSCFQMGLGRKIDPEPGRCRRTDGKKWRCAKEAFQDSKYCEKHMHRGKNRSRKPVEQLITTNSSSHNSLTSLVKSHSSICSSVTSDNQHHQYQYPPPPPPSSYYSNNDNNNHPYYNSRVDLGLDSGSYHRYGSVLKDVVDEHSLFSEECGGSVKGSISVMEDSWQLTPLAMSSSSSSKNSKDYNPYLHHLQLQGFDDNNHSSIKLGTGQSHDEMKQQYYDDESRRYGVDGSSRSREKTVYRFLEERPPSERKDSWLNLDADKSSNCSSFSTTQLTISIPTDAASTSHQRLLPNLQHHC